MYMQGLKGSQLRENMVVKSYLANNVSSEAEFSTQWPWHSYSKTMNLIVTTSNECPDEEDLLYMELAELLFMVGAEQEKWWKIFEWSRHVWYCVTTDKM